MSIAKIILAREQGRDSQGYDFGPQSHNPYDLQDEPELAHAWVEGRREMDTPKNRGAIALGRKGGKAGIGEAKRRGTAAYYRALAAKRKPRPKLAPV